MFTAVREMRRAKLRFALLGGAVGLLVFLLLFFQSVAGSLLSGLTGAVEQTSADVLVYAERARGNPLASVLGPDAVEQVAAVEGVAAAAAVGVSPFTTRLEGESVDAVLVGVDGDGPGLPAAISDGRAPFGVGEALASASSFDEPLDLGQRVTVTSSGGELVVVGQADGAAFNVQTTLYVPFEAYAQAVQARTGADAPVPVSYVAVEAADGVEAVALAERITSEVEGVRAYDRAAAVDALPGVETIGQSFGILYGLLAVVVLIVTGVFFLILTVQKRDALVLLRAVGARRSDVVVPVLVQVAVVVGFGVVVGSGLTALLLGPPATRSARASTPRRSP